MAYYRICPGRNMRLRKRTGHNPTRQRAEPNERSGIEDIHETQGGKVK